MMQMAWFVKKVMLLFLTVFLILIEQGEALEADVPVKIGLRAHCKVSDGYPRTHTKGIYCDSVTETASIHMNSNTIRFAQLCADLSQVPKRELKKLIQREPDGEEYYIFKGAVEATFGSASMKYVYALEGEFYLLLLLSSIAQKNLGVRYDIISIKYT